MLVGDTHGDIQSVSHKISMAKMVGGIQRLVILGDYGLWWGFEGVQFLDQCNTLATAANMQIFAIPGNHECHELWSHMVKGAQEAKATAHGWAYVRSNVLLSPKVHQFRWGGKQFVVAGGAVSIDKDYRLEYERKKGKRIWSPNEQLLDADVDTIADWNRLGYQHGGFDSVDYLLTHDCSNRTPFRGRLKPDINSQIHRQRIDEVLKITKPKMHLHGHMHTRYDWINRSGDDAWTQTYGLECNNDIDSWGVLDLRTGEFTFASDFAL